MIKVPFLEGNAFSFGVIFIGGEVKNRFDAENVIKHEYGHTIHMEMIGPATYLVDVAIPSLCGFWGEVTEYKNYYSQPWEYVADYLGGVTNRTYENGEPYDYQEGVEEYSAKYLLSTIRKRLKIAHRFTKDKIMIF